ncbi:hypothetical protein SEA_ODAY_60 [Gordonia phage ODay]|nr:hypothetical protein SEA_ODAY_60 [Gordonia phage ODay]
MTATYILVELPEPTREVVETSDGTTYTAVTHRTKLAEIGHLDNDFHFMELAHDELTADDMRQVAAAFLAAAQYADELAGDQS